MISASAALAVPLDDTTTLRSPAWMRSSAADNVVTRATGFDHEGVTSDPSKGIDAALALAAGIRLMRHRLSAHRLDDDLHGRPGDDDRSVRGVTLRDANQRTRARGAEVLRACLRGMESIGVA